MQFNHGGREQISASPRAPTAAPSAVPSLRFKTEPRALTHREIGQLIEGYAVSTDHAARGRPGRRGAVDLPRLPARPVPLAPEQPPRRPVRRLGSPPACASPGRSSRPCARPSAPAPWPSARALSADELTPGGMSVRGLHRGRAGAPCRRPAGLRVAGARPFGVPVRLDVDRPSPADAGRRHRPALGRRARRGPARAQGPRHHPGRRPRGRRAHDPRRRRRPGRHDPRADRRSRAHRQDARGRQRAR